MGNQESNNGIQYINFEGVQTILSSSFSTTLLINTLPSHLHYECAIAKTASPQDEETIMNAVIEKRSNISQIVLYGKNSCDKTVAIKLEQFRTLGIIGGGVRVMVYTGGLFEWLLLQEIYGEEQFPIQGNAKKPIDLLKYK